MLGWDPEEVRAEGRFRLLIPPGHGEVWAEGRLRVLLPPDQLLLLQWLFLLQQLFLLDRRCGQLLPLR